MRAAWCLCAALASLALGVAAADEVARVQLRGRAVLPGVYPANQEMATTMPKFLRDGVAGAHALLQSTQGSQTAYIVQQGPDAGNFEFADVPEGIYRLEVRANGEGDAVALCVLVTRHGAPQGFQTCVLAGLAYPAVRVEVDSLGELTLWLADMNHKPLAMNGDRFEIAALGLSHMYELRQVRRCSSGTGGGDGPMLGSGRGTAWP